MKEIKINTEFIKLQQFIKLAGVVGQGSDAKMLIQNGEVLVDEEICTQRGKKIRPENIVKIKGYGSFIAKGE